MTSNPFKTIEKFDWKDLDGKVLKIKVVEPSDSDLNEGQFATQVWGIDLPSMTIYLLEGQSDE